MSVAAGQKLPPGWKAEPLRRVGTWRGGGTPSKERREYWVGGSIPWVSPKDMKVGVLDDAEDYITEEAVDNSATAIVPAGSVLIVVRSGILKHSLPVAVAQRDLAINQDLKAVTPSPGINSSYLAYALRAFARDILDTCTKAGTTVQNINFPALMEYEIPVAPSDQQGPIVEEIEKQLTRLDAGVAALRRVQAATKRYRAAVLKAACEGRLVPTEADLARREGRPYEPGSVLLGRIETERAANRTMPRRPSGRNQSRDAAALPQGESALPGGWSFARLEVLLSARGIRTGPFGSLLKKHEHRAQGLPVLGIENVAPLRFVHGSRIHVSREKAQALASYSAVPGDVLLSRSGTVGEACVVPESVGDARFSTNIIRLALNQAAMAPAFLVVLFYGSSALGHQLEALTGGSTRDFVSQRILRSVAYPVPPRHEQDRIVAEVERRLSLADALDRIVTANLHRSTRLRQSILSSAFHGAGAASRAAGEARR